MSYSVNMIQCRPTAYTSRILNNYQAFPRPFQNLLFSAWVCLGGAVNKGVALSNLISLGKIQVDHSGSSKVHVRLIRGVSLSVAIDASYAFAPGDVLQHILVSLDGMAQTCQVYANDVAVSLSSGGWVGAPTTFDITGSFSNWHVDGSGSAAPGPAVGDLFAAAPAVFYDLSVTANRRAFINADLTPVDLGATADGPLGVPPQIWLTARGGTADEFLTNAGSGGGVWQAGAGTLAFQEPGLCVAPDPPPAPPGRLAMDDVVCLVETEPLSENLVSLRWSDDRGHTFGSPVSQSMGSVGEYRTSLQWQRLAYARDRVFELSWSVPCATALQGAWIDVTPAQS